MSALLFGRKAALVIGTRRLDGLRFSFDVEKKGGRDPNKATIVVANLTETTRAEVSARGLRVVLEAGYESSSDVLFLGKSYRVTHARDGADILTRIEASDGGKEIADSVGSWSFKPSTPVETAIRTVCASMGLPVSTGSRINPKHRTLRNGFAAAGRAVDVLDQLVRSANLSWSIQDAQVQILDSLGDGTADVLLRTDTGMIGSPTRGEVDDKTKKEKLSVRCLIQPRIRPQRLVSIESVDQPALSGRYVVKTLRASGDTHGDDWTMALEIEPLAPT